MRGLVTAWQETKKLNMTNLDGQYQGGPEGEKYKKTTRTGKATKNKNKKEAWRSLVRLRASSSVQPTEEKTEREREKVGALIKVLYCLSLGPMSPNFFLVSMRLGLDTTHVGVHRLSPFAFHISVLFHSLFFFTWHWI